MLCNFFLYSKKVPSADNIFCQCGLSNFILLFFNLIVYINFINSK